MLDHAERNDILYLEHDAPTQRERLRKVLNERNQRMEGTGQEEYMHACLACFLVSEDKKGKKSIFSFIYSMEFKLNFMSLLLCLAKIHRAVCDGVTIGHPCCSVHNCHLPLPNNRALFCDFHEDKVHECAICNCSARHEEGFRTCNLPKHQQFEETYFEHGKAIFQLRERLKKAAGAQSSGQRPDNEEEESGKVETEPEPPYEAQAGYYRGIKNVDVDMADAETEKQECTGKPESGNRKFKASFSRRRTHNEQFIMRPCGIILSRATLYGSESISAVSVSPSVNFCLLLAYFIHIYSV